jgi:hypothetical protein
MNHEPVKIVGAMLVCLAMTYDSEQFFFIKSVLETAIRFGLTFNSLISYHELRDTQLRRICEYKV